MNTSAKCIAFLACLIVLCFLSPASVSAHDSYGWRLTRIQDVAAYPDLKESIWTKRVAPYGPCDRISVHRLAKEHGKTIAAVFILPGTWASGEQMISNPPGSLGAGRLWFKWDQYNITHYLANRGFDVYSIDYRSHFLEEYLAAKYPEVTNKLYTPDQMAFMKDWGWGAWISDIHEAIDLIRAVSGMNKVFLGGESFGGSAVMNYASAYWKQDLLGLILLDGGSVKKQPGDNTYNFSSRYNTMIAAQAWSQEISGPNAVNLYRKADIDPSTPSPDPAYATFLDFYKARMFVAWGPGGVSNIYNVDVSTTPYTRLAAEQSVCVPETVLHDMARGDRYWPARLGLESSAIYNNDNCTKSNPNCQGVSINFDFDDNFTKIRVPVIGFLSGNFGAKSNPAGFQPGGLGTSDVTGYILNNYGHYEVFDGARSAIDVNERVYQWLLERNRSWR